MRYFLMAFASLVFLSGCATTSDKQCAQNPESQECKRTPSSASERLDRHR